MKRLICAVLTLAVALSFASCANAKPLTSTQTALDTLCTISLYDSKDEALAEGGFSLIDTYEAMWSRTKQDSEVTKLNTANGAPTAVSAETLELLQTAQFYSIATQGAFDVTTAALTDVWKAAEREGALPKETAVAAARETIGSDAMLFDSETVTLAKGTTVDLGGIAKGAVADKVAEYLKENGCESALIDLGGNIVAVGSKPNGEPFHVGIADPQNPAQLITTVAVSNRAVVTSGSYQRGYEIGGKHYSHILDPQSGYPVENDLASVTIVAPFATDADALSTACFVMGYDKAAAFLNTLNDIEAVFVKADGTVTATDGVELV